MPEPGRRSARGSPMARRTWWWRVRPGTGSTSGRPWPNGGASRAGRLGRGLLELQDRWRGSTRPTMRSLRQHVPAYPARTRGEVAIEALRAGALGRSVALTEASFSHAQRLDLDGLLGRARSSSYVAHGVGDMRAFEADLTATFETHREAAGQVTLRTERRPWPGSCTVSPGRT